MSAECGMYRSTGESFRDDDVGRFYFALPAQERTLSLLLSLTEFSSRMGRGAKNAESRYRESNGA